MNISEQELEDWIYGMYYNDPENVIERGLPIFGKLLRQVEIGYYGRLDLVCYKRIGRHIAVRVFELKKNEINTDTLLQAARYTRGIISFLNNRFGDDVVVSTEIYLIGNSIQKDSFLYLTDIFYGLEYYTYDFGFNGIEFKHEKGYKLVKEGL